MDDRIRTLHPAGKQGVRIERAKYETVRETLLAALREHGELTFAALTEEATERLAGRFEGSVPWYVTTVKLDLEARGLVRRVPGASPQKLTLADSKLAPGTP